jgi:Zn finger protein HypA/HybF involved in hydrogenase expression
MTLELEWPAAQVDPGTEIIVAGARGAGDYRCLDCGYGIATSGLVPMCPMCHGSHWRLASGTSPVVGPEGRLPEH